MSRNTTKVALEQIKDLAERLPSANTVDVTIEVFNEEIGDQLEAVRLPWHAVVYDTRNEVIELSVGGRDRRIPVVLRHSIRKPTGVWLEQEDGRTVALLIEAEDSPRTIVRFHDRAALGTGGNAKTATPSHR